VSSGGQDESAQLPDIDKYGDSEGVTLVVPDHTLHDKSASKGEQQKYLDDVIARVTRGEFCILVARKADRVELRGIEAYVRFLLALRDAGGELHVADHGRITFEDLLGTTHGRDVGPQGAPGDEDQGQPDPDPVRQDRVSADRRVPGKRPFGYAIIERNGFKWLVPHPVQGRWSAAPTTRSPSRTGRWPWCAATGSARA
jgi:hypothetical protein